MDVDSDDLAPTRPPGLARAGGLPQARVAALQAPAVRMRVGRAQWGAPPPAGVRTAPQVAASSRQASAAGPQQ
eukprot:10986778-Alexandrium_andersonii.AAC.1